MFSKRYRVVGLYFFTTEQVRIDLAQAETPVRAGNDFSLFLTAQEAKSFSFGSDIMVDFRPVEAEGSHAEPF